jgi:hypothetical protein
MRCPACYRAENVRLAQRRYKAHKRKEHEVRLGALKTLLITRIDALIRTNTQKLKIYEVEGTRTLAQRKALERRSKYAVFYAEVRRRILLDIDLGNPKPFAAYINDEELNERVFDTKRLVDGASKTTAVEPQVI